MNADNARFVAAVFEARALALEAVVRGILERHGRAEGPSESFYDGLCYCPDCEAIRAVTGRGPEP
jgi:hypothetical protein